MASEACVAGIARGDDCNGTWHAPARTSAGCSAAGAEQTAGKASGAGALRKMQVGGLQRGHLA